jgi:hypothetical protein
MKAAAQEVYEAWSMPVRPKCDHVGVTGGIFRI